MQNPYFTVFHTFFVFVNLKIKLIMLGQNLKL
jgi:hypothetical protein